MDSEMKADKTLCRYLRGWEDCRNWQQGRENKKPYPANKLFATG
jgi:hypothetical protein